MLFLYEEKSEASKYEREERKREGICEIDRDDRIITGSKKKNNEESRIICDDFREIGRNKCKSLLLYRSCDCVEACMYV